MRPIVAIVGRPNVGKSTLFNRLIRENRALVDDQPGVTRDRLHGVAKLGGREVILVDTGGIETDPQAPFAAGILEHVKRAMDEADVVLFLADGMTGLVPEDREIHRILIKSEIPVVVAVNKCEAYTREVGALEFHELGLEHVYPVSAAHGVGIADLSEALLDRLPDDDDEVEAREDAIRVAVVGRPNVGKSTLVNRLLGQERLLVSDIAGTTRDAVDVDVHLDGRLFRLVDTAGLRRKGKISERIERSSVYMAIRQIERADVVVLMVDPAEGVTHQDQQIASLIDKQNKPCVIGVNKWDLLPAEVRADPNLGRTIAEQLRFLPDAPQIPLSAKLGRGVPRLGPTILDLFERARKRIGTGELNRFLAGAIEANQPPSWRRNVVRLSYMTQVRVAPPTFVIFCNHPEGIPDNYRRFLKNRLRDAFGFQGVPMIVYLRKKHPDAE